MTQRAVGLGIDLLRQSVITGISIQEISRGTPSALAKFCRSHRLPFRVLPLRRLPALSLFPGQTPAQEAKLSAEGNWLISTPISAMTLQAVVRSKPGISANKETASSMGGILFFDFGFQLRNLPINKIDSVQLLL